MFLPVEVEKAVTASEGFKARFGTLAVQPYNKDNPSQSVWWLFKKRRIAWGNWPAYSVGKYFFDRPKEGRGVVRAGLHMEKGIAPANAATFGTAKARHFGMTPKWDWYGFVEDLESGRLEAALLDITRRSGAAVEINLVTEFPVDERKVYEHFGDHRFEFTESGLRLVHEHRDPKKLVGVGEAKTLQGLAQRLRRATDEEPWTWINVFIGCAVPFHEQPPVGAGPAWNGGDFWNRVLDPLAPWVG
jgi:hypothetical protein